MAQDTMTLVIIRHGESEWNKLNLFTGWTDVDLTEQGHKEAIEGGRALKETYATPHFLNVLFTPLTMY